MTESSSITVDADFPGGNIILEEINGDTVRIRQDLRDTGIDWFFWHFRVRGAAGKTLTFQFTASAVIGTHGPAVSTDGGETYVYLPDAVIEEGQSFKYAFAANEDDVLFCFTIPCLERHLAPFLEQHEGNPHFRREELCTTRKGRSNYRLHLGKLDGEPTHRVLLTSRHHCCESIATYCVEGFMAAVLAETDLGEWYRNNVELLVVPFIDKDGVEDGDQGKGRVPRDHGRDYQGESLYPTCAAIREFVPRWSDGRLKAVMDIHCPWIRGKHNEVIYVVGGEGSDIWREQQRFSALLENACSGELRCSITDDLPFGEAWNTNKNYSAGKGIRAWSDELPEVMLGISYEIPYASAAGVTITAENARHLGGDMAQAMREYLS